MILILLFFHQVNKLILEKHIIKIGINDKVLFEIIASGNTASS